MLKKYSPVVLQKINMIARQLFLLFKKSTTYWDNPRTSIFYLHNLLVSSVQMKSTEKHGKETPTNNVSGYQIFCYFMTSHLHWKPAISADLVNRNVF